MSMSTLPEELLKDKNAGCLGFAMLALAALAALITHLMR